MSIAKDPHAGQPVLAAGPPPRDARLALILVHGRGASAEDILGLAAELRLPDVACLAPQAAGHTWYPYSFLSPIEQNEPGISSGLGIIDRLIDDSAARGCRRGASVCSAFRRARACRWSLRPGMRGATPACSP